MIPHSIIKRFQSVFADYYIDQKAQELWGDSALQMKYLLTNEEFNWPCAYRDTVEPSSSTCKWLGSGNFIWTNEKLKGLKSKQLILDPKEK